MIARIDGDILAFETGYGCETGWKAMEKDGFPPFDYAEEMLLQKLTAIMAGARADDYKLYLSEGKCFRYDIAKARPYKANRKSDKPFHFYNLRAYMQHVLNAEMANGIEADDLMALHQYEDMSNSIICSRDKDLRQLEGWFYSWELGAQPSFGPVRIVNPGTLELSTDRKKLKGTGEAFFYAQVLLGDTVDNIRGLPNCGPVRAFNILNGKNSDEMYAAVVEEYKNVFPDTWETELLEQGQLCYLVRELNEDGSPVLWKLKETNG